MKTVNRFSFLLVWCLMGFVVLEAGPKGRNNGGGNRQPGSRGGATSTSQTPAPSVVAQVGSDTGRQLDGWDEEDQVVPLTATVSLEITDEERAIQLRAFNAEREQFVLREVETRKALYDAEIQEAQLFPENFQRHRIVRAVSGSRIDDEGWDEALARAEEEMPTNQDYCDQFVNYTTGPLPAFRADCFDLFLKEQKFELILRFLHLYAAEFRSNDVNFFPMKNWVFLNAEKGHVPLLHFAARIYLRILDSNDRNISNGLLCVVKALVRAAQDIFLDADTLGPVYLLLRNEFYILDQVVSLWVCSRLFEGPYLGYHNPDRWPGFKDVLQEVKAWFLALDSCGEQDKKNYVTVGWCYATTWRRTVNGSNIVFEDVSVGQLHREHHIESISEKRKSSLQWIMRQLEKVQTWRAFFSLTIDQLHREDVLECDVR